MIEAGAILCILLLLSLLLLGASVSKAIMLLVLCLGAALLFPAWREVAFIEDNTGWFVRAILVGLPLVFLALGVVIVQM